MRLEDILDIFDECFYNYEPKTGNCCNSKQCNCNNKVDIDKTIEDSIKEIMDILSGDVDENVDKPNNGNKENNDNTDVDMHSTKIDNQIQKLVDEYMDTKITNELNAILVKAAPGLISEMKKNYFDFAKFIYNHE